MALKYVASNKTYDFGKSEYTTTSNKYKRLNYIANGKTYQIGLATDSTATQYSPLKIKINDSTYYIGISSSRSSSTSYTSTYSSRYLARVNTYTYPYTESSIKTTGYVYDVTHYYKLIGDRGVFSTSYIANNMEFTSPQQSYNFTRIETNSDGEEFCASYTFDFNIVSEQTEIATYTRSESKTSNEYSTTTASSSTSNATTVVSNNFV